MKKKAALRSRKGLLVVRSECQDRSEGILWIATQKYLCRSQNKKQDRLVKRRLAYGIMMVGASYPDSKKIGSCSSGVP